MATDPEPRDARLWWCSPSTTRLPSASPGLRMVEPIDTPLVGRLLYFAFQGAADDRGQPESYYLSKAEAIQRGSYGPWMQESSFAIEDDDGLQSVCLLCNRAEYGAPVVAVIATNPRKKRQGFAETVLRSALLVLARSGHENCCAMITRGNLASEGLFERCGFELLRRQ